MQEYVDAKVTPSRAQLVGVLQLSGSAGRNFPHTLGNTKVIRSSTGILAEKGMSESLGAADLLRKMLQIILRSGALSLLGTGQTCAI